MAKTISRIKEVELQIVEDGEVKEEAVQVEKAPLGKWKKLTDSVKTLFDILPEVLEEKGVENPDEYIEEMTMQDLLMLIPDLLEVATDEVIYLLSLGTGLDEDYIESKVGLDEAIELFEAIIEVNNLIKVVEKAKNIKNLWEKITG